MASSEECQQCDEEQPLLTSVLVSREVPSLMAEQLLVRRIEAFLDYAAQDWLWRASGRLPLRLVKRVAASKEWCRVDFTYSINEAACRGKLDVIQWLCAMVELSGNARTKDLLAGKNPLPVAACSGHLDVMKWLVDNGAQVDQTNEEGFTALMSAAGNGQFAAVQWLVDGGAHVEDTDRSGKTALHAAAAFGSLDIVKYLVEKGARVDGKDGGGKSALHYAAGAYQENGELVQFLVQKGLEPSHADELGRTPLRYATDAQNFQVVEVMLKEYCRDDRPTDVDLSHAFLGAANGDQLGLVEYLVEEYGVDARCTSFQGENALHQAAGVGSVDVVEFLLNLGVDLHQADKFGATPVLEATRHGRLEVLRRLLETGGGITDVNIAGQTALHLAAQGWHTEACQLALGYGADVNCCDKRGWTPLHSAAGAGHIDIVKFLITNGATLEAQNVSGQTARVLAAEHGHVDIAKYLPERAKVDESAKSDPFVEYQEHLLHSAEVYYNLIATTVQPSADGTWLDSPIEVKLKKEWNSKGFLETLKQWSCLNHPHIVKLYGFFHSDNTSKEPYFVCEGNERLARSHGDWHKLYQAALGLQYLHDRNIVHGTLSCDSFAVSPSGVVKIDGFDGGGTYLPWYTAPEILAGLPASFETDVYVFGLVIEESMSNSPAWSIDISDSQDAILSGKPLEKPDHMTTSQWRLVERMCCYNPAERLSMADVVRELEALTKDLSMDQEGSSEFEALGAALSTWSDIGQVRMGDVTVSELLAEIDTMC